MPKVCPGKNPFLQISPTTARTEMVVEEKSDKDSEGWKEVVEKGRKVAASPPPTRCLTGTGRAARSEVTAATAATTAPAGSRTRTTTAKATTTAATTKKT